MVRATHGFILESDVPLTQFVISLNEAAPESEKFVASVLDSTHLLIAPHKVEEVRRLVKAYQDSTVNTVPLKS